MQTSRSDFDECFRAVYPHAYRAALRIAGDRGVAEDAAIEALTRAFVRWRRLRSVPHREAWVLRVVINESLSQLAPGPSCRPRGARPSRDLRS